MDDATVAKVTKELFDFLRFDATSLENGLIAFPKDKSYIVIKAPTENQKIVELSHAVIQYRNIQLISDFRIFHLYELEAYRLATLREIVAWKLSQ